MPPGQDAVQCSTGIKLYTKIAGLFAEHADILPGEKSQVRKACNKKSLQ